MRKRIIISATSGIGSALAVHWDQLGFETIGTFRDKDSGALPASFHGVPCELASASSRAAAIEVLHGLVKEGKWDVLVLAAGTQVPVGKFGEIEFGEWRDSIEINLVSQLEILHGLVSSASSGAQVIMFAGGGTNGSVLNYSAYTISKIAGIKICELLASEYPDLKFTSIGPGWVNTKIHQETIRAGTQAGSNLRVAEERLLRDDFTSMGQVVSAIDWVISRPALEVSGRNFSVVNDPIHDGEFSTWLLEDSNRMKLRRFGNSEYKAVSP